MSGSVPRELMVLLERLGMAHAGAVRAVEDRVRRLGRDLPQFQSVWVDALARARVLTPYQAAEFNAGRGGGLRLGPYVLQAKLSSIGYARRFSARHVESGNRVSLLSLEGLKAERDADAINALAELTTRGAHLRSDGLAPMFECGCESESVWGAIEPSSGRTAAEQVIRHGRMSPGAVLEIARQMVAALTHLEQVGLVHGDVSVPTLMLTEQGQAVLLAPGLRPVVRHTEGLAHADLAPEYYDSVAPEQIDSGTVADHVTDLYGCGCVWWHLLTGRACFAGGDSLGKLQAHLTAEVGDLRSLAPDAPAHLAEAIKSCLARNRGRRPQSASELAERLGSSAPAGRSELTRWVKPSGGTAPIHVPSSRPRATKQATWPMAAVGAALVGLVAVLWAIGLPSKSGNEDREVASQKLTDPLPDEATNGEPVVEPAAPQTDQPEPVSPEASGEIVLAPDGPVTLDSSKLVKGVHVRSQAGGRATVLVRGSPIVVSNDDVLFDGIDFVWQTGLIKHPTSESSAILQVESGRIRFRRCTFQTAAGQAIDCSAIRWVFPIERSDSTLPTGQLSLDDCIFARVDTAVDARTAAALTLEFDNVLHLGPGPLVRLDHTPPVDQPLGLVLTNVTLRQARSVLEVHEQAAVSKPGTISVNAQLCIFDPQPKGALLSFAGPTAPTAIAKAVYWTGEGALVTPEANIAQWHEPSGTKTKLNDAAFSIAGLVRSRVEYAGAAEPKVESNVARRWQAPLPTAEAPGIRGETLPQPAE